MFPCQTDRVKRGDVLIVNHDVRAAMLRADIVPIGRSGILVELDREDDLASCLYGGQGESTSTSE